MKPIRVRPALAAEYPIYAEPGALNRLPRLVAGLGPSAVVLVTDAVVWRLHGRRIAADLAASGIRARVVRIPRGEANKTAETVRRIHDGLLAAGCDRESVVLAVGGGIVGDLAGFAAATFYRGIRYVQVPTTLLAQVDSSVGGKTGHNLPQGKNLIGAFHHPVAVVADADVLQTLPPRQVRAALAEVVKVGVVMDAPLFARVERTVERVLALDGAALSSIVRAAVRIKARVVAEDEREAGLRRILNFGHTIGHAVEAGGGYRRWLHGEAVALGMVAECRLGEILGTTPSSIRPRLKNLLLKAGLPDKLSKKHLHKTAEWINYDKKFARASIRMYLPVALGSAAEVHLVRGELKRLLVRLES